MASIPWTLWRCIVIWIFESVFYCHADISCEFGYIYAKTFFWNTTITSCIHPSSEQEIVDIVTNAMIANEMGNKTTVRAIGASISYSAVGMLDEFDFNTNEPKNVIVLNTTTNLTRIINLNLNEMTLTFQSGLRYIDILEYLELYNLSMYYTGGPSFANFVGWFMTGTHGAGTPNNPIKSMANNVVGMRMVTGNGTVIIMNQTYNLDILNAALISFGSLGIITEVTIKILPKPQYIQQSMPRFWYNQTDLQIINNTFYNDIIPDVYSYDMIDCIYHFVEEYWQCSRWNYVNISNDNTTSLQSESLCWENGAYNRQDIGCTDIYYKALSAPTMEYAIAGNRRWQTEWFITLDKWPSAQMAVIDYIYTQKLENTSLWRDTYNYVKDIDGWKFFASFRFVGGDNIWLSPGGLDNETIMAQISIQFAEGMPQFIGYKWILEIYQLLKENYSPVRVHWGKISMANYCDLKDSYPKFDDFIHLREELDPYDLFLNSFTRDKLGLCDDKCCCTNTSCLVDDTISTDSELDILLISVITGSVVIIIVIAISLFICYKNKARKDNTNQHELSNLLKH